ncbi:MAG: hypothetical protein H0X33_09780 [Taibaiella sp.]|nr:hypothetical protein [Taibaiella sp.]
MTNPAPPIERITRLLHDPNAMTDADRENISAVINTYSYFIPARYIQAILQHKKEPYSQAMMARMQLYTGNWLLFWENMENSTPLSDDHLSVVPPVVKTSPVAHIVNETLVVPEHVVPLTPVSQIIVEENTLIPHIINDTIVIPEHVVPLTPIPRIIVEENTLVQPDIPPENFHMVESVVYIPASSPPEMIVESMDHIPPLADIPLPTVPLPHHVAEVPFLSDEDIKAPVNVPKATGHIQEMHVAKEEVIPEPIAHDNVEPREESIISPVYTEDYFLHQGVPVSNDLPPDAIEVDDDDEAAKSLMVVMSFGEWLMHFKTHSAKSKEEEKDQKALRSMWQKEKLAAAMEEENEEIPENVFEMAMNSIANEEDVISESLADIYIKQRKYDKAIEMYSKLSLRNPQKSTYLARRIEEVKKEKNSW